ncbi:hypothetical protein [Sagittula sp. SSi028]|uniref:hypothetical protein n=1 Tax=Sagittula sp. SSi028 TaxID=3400636 RepID=UPI003AF47F44
MQQDERTYILENHPNDIWLTYYRSHLLNVSSERYAYAADREVWETASPKSLEWLDQLTMPKSRRPVSLEQVDTAFATVLEMKKWDRETIAAIQRVVRSHVEEIAKNAEYEGPAFPNLMFTGELAWEFADALASALTPGDVHRKDDLTKDWGQPLVDDLLRAMAASEYAQIIVLTEPLNRTAAIYLDGLFIDVPDKTVSVSRWSVQVDISHVTWFGVLDVPLEDVPETLLPAFHLFRIDAISDEELVEHLVGVAVQQTGGEHIDEIRQYAEQLLRTTTSRDPGGLADVMLAYVRDEL